MEKYTIYWLGGSKEILSGRNIADAFNRNGYGAGVLKALDFYEKGDSTYEWDKAKREWIKNKSLTQESKNVTS